MSIAVLVLGLFALGADAGPVLPQAASAGFQKLIASVNDREALGPDVEITGISIDRNVAKIGIELPGQSEPAEVIVGHPTSQAGTKSRWFGVARPKAWKDDASWKKFVQALDNAFDKSPWLVASKAPRGKHSGDEPKATPPRSGLILLAVTGLVLVGVVVWRVRKTRARSAGTKDKASDE